jgi:hypothetical protein
MLVRVLSARKEKCVPPCLLGWTAGGVPICAQTASAGSSMVVLLF